ncbi:hypothetical protein C8R44DRAFT_806749 [Mycena epipterygia]|nr:hypothetical protein C8R44DRAFT_806749 [Mycena epipterygia]
MSARLSSGWMWMPASRGRTWWLLARTVVMTDVGYALQAGWYTDAPETMTRTSVSRPPSASSSRGEAAQLSHSCVLPLHPCFRTPPIHVLVLFSLSSKGWLKPE